MIVPLLPTFVIALGGTAETLGLIEGLADATAGLFRLVSGALADRLPRRKPLIVAGYLVSSCVRPLVALAAAPWHVVAVRFFDRVGKGMRASPRDALVADVTAPGDRGRAYGLHRAMDHLGNVIGPLIAFLFLRAHAGDPSLAQLRTLFGWAALPAALALATLFFLVREPKARPRDAGSDAAAPRPAFSIVPPKVPALRRLLLALVVFGLGESTDAFLLLRAMQLQVPVIQLPLLVVVFSAVKSAFSTPLGALSDRVARRTMILAGWSLYAAVYAGFAFAGQAWHAWLLFAVYGLYYALVEGAERALVSELVPLPLRGRAFGSFHFATAIVALPASWLFGRVMQSHGATAAFLLGAAFAAAGALLLLLGVPARGANAEAAR